MATTTTHLRETQRWLVDTLEETAVWRDDKAREYPDDPRNARSAVSLRIAATYIRMRESAGVIQIAGLVDECLASGIDLVGTPGFPGSESERAAGRYGFDRYSEIPGPEDHEELLDTVYEAILRDLRDNELTPDSPLARRLAESDLQPPPHGVTADRETALKIERLRELSKVADLLIEISDTARLEAGADGRLPILHQPTRLPLLRRRLSVALAASRALGAPALEQCRKVVEEPPQFATQTISGIVTAVEEVQRAVDAEGGLVGSQP